LSFRFPQCISLRSVNVRSSLQFKARSTPMRACISGPRSSAAMISASVELGASYKRQVHRAAGGCSFRDWFLLSADSSARRANRACVRQAECMLGVWSESPFVIPPFVIPKLPHPPRGQGGPRNDAALPHAAAPTTAADTASRGWVTISASDWRPRRTGRGFSKI
jgi:hypothetical protein